MTANSQPFRFGYDSVKGKYGYILNQGGADTVIPFNSGVGNFTSNNFSIRMDYYDYSAHPMWTKATGYVTFDEETKQVTITITKITGSAGDSENRTTSATVGIVEQ